jgi:hypothetical protein
LTAEGAWWTPWLSNKRLEPAASGAFPGFRDEAPRLNR